MTTEREIICLQVGKAGIGSGFSSQELMMIEHGLRPDGMFDSETEKKRRVNLVESTGHRSFYKESNCGKLTPRLLFLDHDGECVEETITYGPYRHFFPKESIVCGKESAVTFSRGYLSLGKGVIEESLNRIRSLVNDCGNLDGFMIFSSPGGGTGSGLGSLLLEKLSDEYPKKSKFGMNIFSSPSDRNHTNIVDPYNTILSMQRLTEHMDLNFMFGNDALNDICTRSLDLEKPNFVHYNRLISQVFCSSTRNMRFDGCLNVDLIEMQTNLVPYPRISFICSSYAPIIHCERAITEQPSCTEITSSCFQDYSNMWKCKLSENKYMACILMYLGDYVPKDISAAVGYIKTKRTIQFVDWTPTGFKCSISYQRPRAIPGGEMAQLGRACCMTANTTAVKDGFGVVKQKYDVMVRKRAFFHWFLKDGMEEEEFSKAGENVESLMKDYEEILSEQISDDEFEEGEEEEEEEGEEERIV